METEEITLEDKVKQATIVTLKPMPRAGKRLGLADTSEKFMRMPGTVYTWVPSKRGRIYVTGLSQEEEVEYGRKLGQDLSKTSEFWSTLKFTLTEKPLGFKLDLSNPLEYVVFKAMNVSELIAESLNEYKNGNKPYAEWYIENQEAEAEAKAKLADIKINAYGKFRDISDNRKKDIAKILGLKPYGLSSKAAAARLFDFIEEKPQNSKLFMDVEGKKDDIIAISALIEDCIHYNILRRNKAQDYQFADEVLGTTKDQIVTKLLKPENQVLRIKLGELVEAKS